MYVHAHRNHFQTGTRPATRSSSRVRGITVHDPLSRRLYSLHARATCTRMRGLAQLVTHWALLPRGPVKIGSFLSWLLYIKELFFISRRAHEDETCFATRAAAFLTSPETDVPRENKSFSLPFAKRCCANQKSPPGNYFFLLSPRRACWKI